MNFLLLKKPKKCHYFVFKLSHNISQTLALTYLNIQQYLLFKCIATVISKGIKCMFSEQFMLRHFLPNNYHLNNAIELEKDSMMNKSTM